MDFYRYGVYLDLLTLGLSPSLEDASPRMQSSALQRVLPVFFFLGLSDPTH